MKWNRSQNYWIRKNWQIQQAAERSADRNGINFFRLRPGLITQCPIFTAMERMRKYRTWLPATMKLLPDGKRISPIRRQAAPISISENTSVFNTNYEAAASSMTGSYGTAAFFFSCAKLAVMNSFNTTERSLNGQNPAFYL